MKNELGYPDGRPVPDHYGLTVTGAGIVWERKSRRHIQRALTQLEMGATWLKEHGQRVEMAGIVVDRLNPKDPWRRLPDGYLALRVLATTPATICGMRVMVEEGRDR
jgi:hypothetical protein